MSSNFPVQKIESNGPNDAGLTDWPAMDPADLVSGNPIQRGYLYEELDPIGYSCGVWDCTAFTDQPGPYPVDEFMLLLDGDVHIILPDGERQIIRAGDAFIIPKGLECQWIMPGRVLKIFMILDGGEPSGIKNLSHDRVTVLRSDTNVATLPNAICTQHTGFMNHDQRMSVSLMEYTSAFTGKAPTGARQIVHVRSGAVNFPSNSALKFEAGDSFYVLPEHDLDWHITKGTQLLISECRVS